MINGQGHYERGFRIRQLDPVLYIEAERLYKWNSDFSKTVVNPVLNSTSTRRTARTRLVLDDGIATFPGSDLLPMTITTGDSIHGMSPDSNRGSGLAAAVAWDGAVVVVAIVLVV